MTVLRPCLCAVALALPACGGGGGGVTPDAGPDVPDAREGAPDLSRASWELEPVMGAGDSGFNPMLAFDGAGRALVVWQKNDASAIGFAIRDPGTVERNGSWSVQFISPPVGANGVFAPDVAGGAGDEAHIVFSGSTSATGSDIFYVHWDGAALSAATNLTAAGQGGNDTDFSPAVAANAAGEVAVLYSYVPDPDLFTMGEVRAISFSDPGSAGAPETPPTLDRECGQVRVRVDAGGVVHAVAVCRGGAVEEPAYLTNRSGSFLVQSADAGDTSAVIAPDLDVGSAGEVHISFQGRTPCGDTTCTAPFYSVNLGRAAPAAAPSEGYFSPVLALDAWDRPIVTFFDLPDRVLFWTFREDAGFFRPQQVAPGGGMLAGAADDDPATGLPWVVLENRNDSTAIWLARLVP